MTATPAASASPENPVSFWLRPWALDARSLAVFRIAVAAVLLYDYGHRLTDFAGMYTEGAVMPLDFVQEYYRWTPMVVSPFLLSAAPWAQGLAFTLAIVAAAALLLGCWTRVATVVSWVCVCSVQMRTPLVQSGGDDLLRLLVFWGMFLPLGQRWSLDALWSAPGDAVPRIRPPQDENALFSPGTVGLVMQICIVYWVTAIYKVNPIWLNGDALLWSFPQDQYGTSYGEMLLAWPALVRLMTYTTLAIEIVAPLLLMVPWGNAWWRMLNIVLFIGMHVGIDIFLIVGLFSPVCIAAWLVFLPTEFWQWPMVHGFLSRWGLEAQPVESAAAADEKEAEPAVQVADELEAGRRWPTAWHLAHVAWQTVAACTLAYVLWWNVDTLDKSHLAHLCGVDDDLDGTGCWIMPGELRRPGFQVWLRQYWSMFGRPGNVTLWWAMRARLADGSEVDPMRGGEPFSEHKPSGGNMAHFKNHRWQKMFRSMTTTEGIPFLRTVTQWHIREWNASHPPEQQIVTLDVLMAGERIGDSGELVTKVVLRLPESQEDGSGAFANALRERDQ